VFVKDPAGVGIDATVHWEVRRGGTLINTGAQATTSDDYLSNYVRVDDYGAQSGDVVKFWATVTGAQSGVTEKTVPSDISEWKAGYWPLWSVTLTVSPLPQPSKATISITTIGYPFGGVYVNGVYWGFAPQSRQVDPGTYTVSFEYVSNYSNPQPPSQTRTLTAGDVWNVVGDYGDFIPPTPHPPPAPTLTSPVDGEIIWTTTPRLDWQDVTGYSVDYYWIEVCNAETGEQVVWTSSSPSYYDVPSGTLNWGRTYRWHVTAHNPVDYGPWSEWRSFTVGDIVTLYEDTNYSRDSVGFSSDVLNLHDYGWGDRVKSVKVIPGYSVKLYQHPNFEGEVIWLLDDDPDIVEDHFYGSGLFGSWGASSLEVVDYDPDTSLNYSKDYWDRLWYVVKDQPGRPWGAFIGETSESDKNFDEDWGDGALVYGWKDWVGFRSSRKIWFDADTYLFTVGSDDGVRLWVDLDGDGTFESGELVIDSWYDRGYTVDSVPMTFGSSGDRKVRLDYYEKNYPARVSFNYQKGRGPNAPSAPIGPSGGAVGEDYLYSTYAQDPDGDQVRYGWDWDGNGSVDEWSSFSQSGWLDSRWHSWSSSGTYSVRVKAEDSHGNTSNWSEPLEVTIEFGHLLSITLREYSPGESFGSPVEGAGVSLSNLDSGMFISGESGSDGKVAWSPGGITLISVPSGKYHVYVTHPNYYTFEASLLVEDMKTPTYELTPRPSPGQPPREGISLTLSVERCISVPYSAWGIEYMVTLKGHLAYNSEPLEGKDELFQLRRYLNEEPVNDYPVWTDISFWTVGAPGAILCSSGGGDYFVGAYVGVFSGQLYLIEGPVVPKGIYSLFFKGDGIHEEKESNKVEIPPSGGVKTGSLSAANPKDSWAIPAVGSQIISATMVPGSDYDLYLYDPDNNLVASSTRRGEDLVESITYTALMDGTYYIEVRRFTGSGSYYLYIDKTPSSSPILRENHCGREWSQHDSPLWTWASFDLETPVTQFEVYRSWTDDTFYTTEDNYHPILRDGSHYIRVRAQNSAGLWSDWSDELWVYIDTVPPTSSANVIEPYWQNQAPFTITATASDDLSGIASVELFYRYSPDNSIWSSWASFGADNEELLSWFSDAPQGDGYYEFYTIAVDRAGNAEAAPENADAQAGVDTASPVSAVDSVKPYWQNSVPFTITVTAGDPVPPNGATPSGLDQVQLFYRYSPDNSTWNLWKLYGIDDGEPWSWTFDALDGDGFYEFYSVAKDTALNVELAPERGDLNRGVDTTPPVSSLNPIELYWQNAGMVPFEITATASDPAPASGASPSGLKQVELYYRYSTDNATWGEWLSYGVDREESWSWIFDASRGDGYYEFCTMAADVALNVEVAPERADLNLGVDTTPPTTVHELHGVLGGAGWWRSAVEVTLSGVGQTLYRVDGGDWQTYTSPFLISGDGIHSVDYYSVDISGNDEEPKSVEIRIDKLPPVTSHELSGTAGDAGWWVSDVTVTLSTADDTSLTGDVSGVDYTEYSINGGEWTTYLDPILIHGDGVYIVDYRSLDIAGSEEADKPIEVRVDTTPPVSSVDQIEPYWRDSTSFVVSATASDALSGVMGVELYYRSSIDGLSWTEWKQYGVDNAAPYDWSFTAPDGYALYEFYSVAADIAGNVESATETADTGCGVVIPATIDIDPDTLNLKSKGKWITAYIELSSGHDLASVDVGTIMLEGVVPAESHPTEIGDHDGDGIPDLMVKFDRQAVQELLEPGDVELTVTGSWRAVLFKGSDTIRVIEPGGGNLNEPRD
jgi:hypothetical protein